MKICIGQIEVKPGRPVDNTQSMLEVIDKARKDGAEMVIFPEMAIPGYLIGDIWEQTSFLKECESCGDQIRKASSGIVVIYGNVAMDWRKKNEDGRVRKYNACFIAEDGVWQSFESSTYPFIIKTLQPNYREFDDNRHFYDYRKFIATTGHKNIHQSAQSMPLVLKSGMRIGCILCEDAWSKDYSYSPIKALAYNNPDLIINISCSPFTSGKNEKRHRLFSDMDSQFGGTGYCDGIPMAYVNCVGIQDNGKTVYTIDGESCIYDKSGGVLEVGEPFVESANTIDIDLASDFGDKDYDGTDDIDKLYAAVRYGTMKFMERFGIDKVVIGASGGIDSALVAAIMSEILPPENIYLVNMPSQYNSGATRSMAFKLANNIGCNYDVLEISDSVELTSNQFEQAGLSLSEFNMENVQARDRSARILAAYASHVGGVFTCNANKSEMTIGYTTMYGDLGGFLAPISDLWKTQVYEMAKWFNENVNYVIPEGSINITPSAELNTDQVDPLNYEYHDLLFSSWVERWERATPEDILRWEWEGRLEKELGWLNKVSILHLFDNDYKKFIDDLERWWNCYQGLAVAKRIQAPPVIAVSRRAFGFDHREAQVGVYYSKDYRMHKEDLLDWQRSDSVESMKAKLERRQKANRGG